MDFKDDDDYLHNERFQVEKSLDYLKHSRMREVSPRSNFDDDLGIDEFAGKICQEVVFSPISVDDESQSVAAQMVKHRSVTQMLNQIPIAKSPFTNNNLKTVKSKKLAQYSMLQRANDRTVNQKSTITYI